MGSLIKVFSSCIRILIKFCVINLNGLLRALIVIALQLCENLSTLKIRHFDYSEVSEGVFLA